MNSDYEMNDLAQHKFDDIDSDDKNKNSFKANDYDDSLHSDIINEHKYTVRHEDIKTREGNYIFTVGNTNCGKSTLQRFMIYRLAIEPSVRLEFASQDSDNKHIEDAILNKWISDIDASYLPDRTQVGSVQEFTIKLSQNEKKPLSVSFLEISGEDIEGIVPSSSMKKPQLLNELTEYLRADKNRINKRFIFVSDASMNQKNKQNTRAKTRSEDTLFRTLLDYLLGKDTLNMDKLNILFVVSKWDIIQHEYKNINEYVIRNFPQTVSILRSKRCDVIYTPFSVGRVSEEEHKGRTVYRIVGTYETKYVENVIQWVYHTFTNKQLKGFSKIKFDLIERLRGIFS